MPLGRARQLGTRRGYEAHHRKRVPGALEADRPAEKSVSVAPNRFSNQFVHADVERLGELIGGVAFGPITYNTPSAYYFLIFIRWWRIIPLIKIVRTRRYSKDIKKLKASAEDVDAMERTVAADPFAGALIQGLKGVRKARFRIGNRGKSGGGRVIYYVLIADDAALMITAYAKAEKEDLSSEDRTAILRMLEEFNR